jgi:hypothetical protein
MQSESEKNGPSSDDSPNETIIVTESKPKSKDDGEEASRKIRGIRVSSAN